MGWRQVLLKPILDFKLQTLIPSPLRGMATKKAGLGTPQEEIGSKPTVWDGTIEGFAGRIISSTPF